MKGANDSTFIIIKVVNYNKKIKMIKKVLKSITIVAFAIIAGYNVYLSNVNKYIITDIMLTNVEALARNESEITCSQYCSDGIGKCWTKSFPNRCVMSGSQYDFCHTGMDGGRNCVKLDGTEYN